MRIIELGIILFSTGFLLNGARLPSNEGILIARLIIMIVGLLMMKGFFMMKEV